MTYQLGTIRERRKQNLVRAIKIAEGERDLAYREMMNAYISGEHELRDYVGDLIECSDRLRLLKHERDT